MTQQKTEEKVVRNTEPKNRGKKTMTSALFFALFIVLAFTVLALLAVFSSDKKDEKKVMEKVKITSIDSSLIEVMKEKYIKFVHAIINKDSNALKTICTNKLMKNINLDESSGIKIICILNSNVLKIENNEIEVEFISRSINTEILYNKCTFFLLNNVFKLDSVTI